MRAQQGGALGRAARSRLVVALVLAADLAIGAAGGALATFHDDPATVVQTGSASAATAVRARSVHALLEHRSHGVLHRDKAEFMATVDSTQLRFAASQSKLFDNLAVIPLSDWRYLLNASQEDPARTQAMQRYRSLTWVPQVELRYAIRGFDTVASLVPQKLTFVLRDQGWLIGSDSDFADAGSPSGKGIWDFGPVSVVTGKTSLVLGHRRTTARLRNLAGLADDAVAHATEVWGTRWSRHVVLIVPDTQEELAAIISEGNDLSQIAAVAVAQNPASGDGTQRRVVGDRVLVNPVNFDRLSEIGRRVVLRHELTHVATRSATGAIMPSWLVEGFADYVGYLQAGIAVPVVAHELEVDVRAGRFPADLPTDSDFLSTASGLAQSYEMAWLACRLIANTYSQETLVAFYRAVGASKRSTEVAALEDACRKVLGISYSTFVARWRSDVRAELK